MLDGDAALSPCQVGQFGFRMLQSQSRRLDRNGNNSRFYSLNDCRVTWQHPLKSGNEEPSPGDPVLTGWPSNAGTLWWNWTASADGLLNIWVANGALGLYHRMPDGRWLTRAEVIANSLFKLRVNAGQPLELMLVGSQSAAARLELQPYWDNDDYFGRATL